MKLNVSSSSKCRALIRDHLPVNWWYDVSSWNASRHSECSAVSRASGFELSRPLTENLNTSLKKTHTSHTYLTEHVASHCIASLRVASHCVASFRVASRCVASISSALLHILSRCFALPRVALLHCDSRCVASRRFAGISQLCCFALLRFTVILNR